TELDQEFNNMSFIHFRYAAYIINLAVKAEMKYVGDEIKKLHQFNSTYLMIARQTLMQNISELLITTSPEDLDNLFSTISE
ncbi:7909_t:CDS:2, partial [Funneliformis caledonium]